MIPAYPKTFCSFPSKVRVLWVLAFAAVSLYHQPRKTSYGIGYVYVRKFAEFFLGDGIHDS